MTSILRYRKLRLNWLIWLRDSCGHNVQTDRQADKDL